MKKLRIGLLGLFTALVLFAGWARAGDPAPPPGTPLSGANTTPTDEQVIGYAFAKASPLPVYDRADLSTSHDQPFEFGKAYPVVENTSDHLKLKLADGTEEYVKLAHLRFVASPRWISATSVFRMKDRNQIRFWESSARLNDFLAGLDTAHSKWDYEEYFDSPPDFSAKWPVIGSDTLELLGGSRQVDIANVLLPITRDMNHAFSESAGKVDEHIDLYFLLDVSGSTRGFLEAAMSDVAKAINLNDDLRTRTPGAMFAIFGINSVVKAKFIGPLPLSGWNLHAWHGPPPDKPTPSDVEPLVNGFASLASGLSTAKPRGGGLSALIVLSGADVDSTSTVRVVNKTVDLKSIELPLPSDTITIVAQVTPEPGRSLEAASKLLPVSGDVQYLGFSESIGGGIADALAKYLRARQATSLDPKAFGAYADAAHAGKFVAFLPAELTASSRLPQPQAYAEHSEWYTVPLWLPVDGVVLRQVQ